MKALLAILGVLLTALLSVVAWIAVQVWDMNPKVTNTERRVDRIVDVLPDVKIRIAQEDVSRRIPAAVVTTEPIKTAAGEWMTVVHLVDYTTGKRRTYKIRLKGPDDVSGSYLVSGLAYGASRERISFAQCSYAAAQVGQSHTLAAYVDGTASFAILRTGNDLEPRFRKLLGAPISETTIEKKTMKWEQIAEDLTNKEAQYRVTPQ